MIDPRDIYQAKITQDIYSEWNRGERNTLAVLPTGGGKSVIVSGVVRDFAAQQSRGVVIAHRNELVAQMSGHIARRGIWHRIIGPDTTISQIRRNNRAEFGQTFINNDAPISVGGIDTIVSRKEKLTPWAAQQSFWVIDEAHHVLQENKWGLGVSLFKNAIGLGVTASPCRADGNGLGIHADGVFNTMVCGPTMRELIEMGALTDYEIVIAESDLVIEDDAIGATGDYSQKKLKDAAKKSHIVGDVVTEYIKHAFGKRAICFATDVEKATEIAENFKAFGIQAAAVSAKSTTDYREEMIRRFRDGSISVLVNVDLFGEGFDVPACEVVIMARPTASLAVYLQQFGRALRTLPGKMVGLIIDHVGNWKRHGFPDKPHCWTLDRREKRSIAKRNPYDLTACPNCGKPHELFHPVCPYCGYAPEPGTPATRNIEQIDGNLILLDREILAQMRAETELESPASMGERVAFAAGDFAAKGAMSKQMDKIAAQNALKDEIANWAGYQRSLGRSDAESYKRFYLMAGVDVLGSLNKNRTRQEYEALTEQIKTWGGR